MDKYFYIHTRTHRYIYIYTYIYTHTSIFAQQGRKTFITHAGAPLRRRLDVRAAKAPRLGKCCTVHQSTPRKYYRETPKRGLFLTLLPALLKRTVSRGSLSPWVPLIRPPMYGCNSYAIECRKMFFLHHAPERALLVFPCVLP